MPVYMLALAVNNVEVCWLVMDTLFAGCMASSSDTLSAAFIMT